MNMPKDVSNSQNERLGILLRIGSGLLFTVMVGLIKVLDQSVPIGQLVFARSAFALIPLVSFLVWQHDFPSGLHTKYPWMHVVRCILGTVAMFTAFAVLRYLPVAEATTLSYLSPVVLVILAAIYLKETVSARRWWGVVLGAAGLLVMTVPSFSSHLDTRTLIGVGLGLVTACLIAGAYLQVRQLAKMGENPGAIAFYFAITGTIIGALTLMFNWVTPTPLQWACLVGVGLLGGMAQICMTLSFKYAEASAMAPYEYLSILWAVLLGMMYFNEIPSVSFWFAAPLILAGAIVAKPATRK